MVDYLFYNILYCLSFNLGISERYDQKKQIDDLLAQVADLQQENSVFKKSKQSDRLEQIAYKNVPNI